MDQPAFSPPLPTSKPAFVSSNALFIALVFLIGHVGLVKLYDSGDNMTLITGAVLASVLIVLLVRRNGDRFAPLLVGVLLWALLGEIADQLRYVSIVRVRNVLLLSPAIVFVGYWVRRERLSDFLTVATIFFMTIWACHFVLINLFVLLGPTHLLSYVSSSAFVAMFVFALFNIRQAEGRTTLTVHSVFLMCSVWSMLEFAWAWEILQKPF